MDSALTASGLAELPSCEKAPRVTSPSAESSSPGSLGPLHLRLFALLIDYLLVVIAVNLWDQLFLGAGWDLHPPELRNEGGLTYWILFGGGLILTKDAWFGRSPGKWFTGIAVRRADDPDRLPRRSALVLRNLPLILLPVEAVLVFTDPYCRRLGDRWAQIPTRRRQFITGLLVQLR